MADSPVSRSAEAASTGRAAKTLRPVFLAGDHEVLRGPGSPPLYRKVADDIKAAIAARPSRRGHRGAAIAAGRHVAGTRLPGQCRE